VLQLDVVSFLLVNSQTNKTNNKNLMWFRLSVNSVADNKSNRGHKTYVLQCDLNNIPKLFWSLLTQGAKVVLTSQCASIIIRMSQSHVWFDC